MLKPQLLIDKPNHVHPLTLTEIDKPNRNILIAQCETNPTARIKIAQMYITRRGKKNIAYTHLANITTPPKHNTTMTHPDENQSPAHTSAHENRYLPPQNNTHTNENHPTTNSTGTNPCPTPPNSTPVLGALRGLKCKHYFKNSPPGLNPPRHSHLWKHK